LSLATARLWMGDRVRTVVRRLELQTVADARIEENLERRERDYKPFGDAVERQLHLEPVLGDVEIPEAVLQNDRHLLGILVPKTLGEDDASCLCVEGNIEVVITRKPALCGTG